MNKKGFTLAELLGVILLLSVIALIIIPPITNVLQKGSDKADKQLEENIVLAAKSWSIDHKEKITNKCNVTLDTLQNEGYIDKNVVMPSTKENIDAKKTCVTITKVGKKNTYTYDNNCKNADICA